MIGIKYIGQKIAGWEVDSLSQASKAHASIQTKHTQKKKKRIPCRKALESFPNSSYSLAHIGKLLV
ncbi:MAG TPA: hypothetical protein O0X55_00970, partial [Methanocorpusculum sp.]|nr:hypothetical protein [Methanocorpusculum sp.]